MWVGGKSLREIAEASFGDVEDESKRMTECCRMIFQRLTHGASWGLGALQSLAGIEYDKLSSEQKESFRTSTNPKLTHQLYQPPKRLNISARTPRLRVWSQPLQPVAKVIPSLISEESIRTNPNQTFTGWIPAGTPLA
jgi:hypothetical protein